MAGTATRARVTIEHHPDGMAHTRSTIRTMARLAREGSHTYPIRSLATRIVKDVPSKQVRSELAALYTWVRDNIRYRFDPLGLEWVQSPDRTIKEAAGDCDDMATLLAAFAGALGHKWRFRTVGPSKDLMKHVCAEAWDGHAWVTLDPVLEPAQPTTAPRSGDVGRFGQIAPARAALVWSDEGAQLGRYEAKSLADSRRRVRELAHRGHDVDVVHVRGGGRIVAKSRTQYRGRGHVRHIHLNGAVGNRGIALWEGQLGGCRCLHVETPASLARMRAARRAGLSGTVSEGGRDLWSWAAYYPSDPSRGWSEAGVAPIPSPAYRSQGVAGPIVFTAPEGELQEGVGYIGGLGDLGFGFLKKIGKAVSGAVKVVGKIPGVGLAVKAATSIIPGASLAIEGAKMTGKLVGKVAGGGGAKAAVSADAGAGASANVSAGGGAALDVAAAKDMIAPPAACGPTPASRGDIDKLAEQISTSAKYCTKSDLAPLMAAIADRNNKACAAQLAEARKRSLKEIADTKAAAKKAQAKAVATAKALVLKTAKKQALKAKTRYAKKISKLSKRLKAFKAGKYPKGSRQKFDPTTNTWKVYAPSTTAAQKSTLHGLGFAIRPTLSFSLGALGDVKKTAPAALKAIADFMKKNKGQPPQVALPALKAFQSDVGLKPDGLYGPNARAALAWSLVRTDLPAVAKPYAKAKVTWHPPVAKPAVVKAAAAKKPAALVAAVPPKAIATAASAPSAAMAPPLTSLPLAPTAAIILPPEGPGIVDSGAFVLPTAGAQSIARPVLVQDVITSAALPVAVPADTSPIPKGYVPVDRTSTDPKLPSIAKVPEHYIDVSGPKIVDASKKKKRSGKRGGKRHGHGGSGIGRGLLWAALGYVLAQSMRRAA